MISHVSSKEAFDVGISPEIGIANLLDSVLSGIL